MRTTTNWHKIQLLLGTVFLAALAVFVFPGSKADALSASNFQPGNIISTAVFTDKDSMSAQNIQDFLNSQVTDCDTSGSQTFVAPNGQTMTHAQWGAIYDTDNNTNIGAAPYVCLENYVENPSNGQNNLQNPSASIAGGESAAQIIYNAAQQYDINPQVLIVTLQKEQGLITDNWPWLDEYTEAMGYNCPDNPSGCQGYAGFFQQVNAAAEQFRNYLNNPDNYNYVVGNNTIDYGVPPPYGSCSSSSNVNIQNQSTAALYDYTPYQPDSNVLANTNPTGSSSGPGNAVSGDSCATYGIRNFWWYYNTWFGSEEAWADEGVGIYTDSARTIPANPGLLAPNTTYYLELNAENLGVTTWTPGQVNLGTTNPTNRSSIFCDPSWLNYGSSCNRAATVMQSSVAPGQTGTFEFSIKTPSTYGDYKEYFNIVIEGVAWLNDIGLYWNLNIAPPTYAWAPVSQSIASDSAMTTAVNQNDLAPNSTYYLQVKAENVGNTTWTNSGPNPVRLGTDDPPNQFSNLCTGGWISCNRPALLEQSSVPTGEVGTFEFPIQTPSTDGMYNSYFNLVADGDMWMNDLGLYWPLNVSPPLALWQYVGVQAYTDSTETTTVNMNDIANNIRFYMVISALNNGNTTWTNSGPNPVRLGTDNPIDNSSAFCDSTWVSCNRPATLTQSSVAPGQIGTFAFWMQAPYANNGFTYDEYMRPVVEGSMWMNDIGSYWPITMQSSTTSWQYEGQSSFSDSGYSIPANLTSAAVNTTYYLELFAKNTSGLTWTNSGPNPLRLGIPNNVSSPFCNSSWVDYGSTCDRPAVLSQSSVAPGQTGTFLFSITTPSSPINTEFQVRPVIDGLTWLDDKGVYWQVTD